MSHVASVDREVVILTSHTIVRSSDRQGRGQACARPDATFRANEPTNPPSEEAVVQGRCLVNGAMDLGDRHFGLAHPGRVEASCRSNLAHRWHER